MDITFLEQIIQFILNFIPGPIAILVLVGLAVAGYFLRKRIKRGSIQLSTGAIKIKGVENPLFGKLEFEKQEDGQFELTIKLEDAEGVEFITLTFDDYVLPLQGNKLTLNDADFKILQQEGKKLSLKDKFQSKEEYEVIEIDTTGV
jgi:hypothetical protein